MNVTDALEYLKKDLERYAESGKARPETVEFKQRVINTLIGRHNEIHQVELERDEFAHRAAKANLKVDQFRAVCILNDVAPAMADNILVPDGWMEKAKEIEKQLAKAIVRMRQENRKRLRAAGWRIPQSSLTIAEFTGAIPSKSLTPYQPQTPAA